MPTNPELSPAKKARQIGSWGTLSRVLLGGLFIAFALRQGVSLSDAAIGLVVFPAAVSVALALRGRGAPALRWYGPAGYGLTFLIWGVAYGLAPVPTLLFGSSAQLLAAARGYAGCELLAVSNWIRRRDDQIACPVHSIVDAAEAQAKGHHQARVR